MTYFHFVEVCVKGTDRWISTLLDGFSGEICCYISWEMDMKENIIGLATSHNSPKRKNKQKRKKKRKNSLLQNIPIQNQW